MNILLIEDEARVADFVRRGLAAEGWSVDHAANGEDGLELAAQNNYDVVLLDLMLPGIQGQGVCRKLRARKSKTPIMMLTALDGSEEKVEGLKIGADDYLPKPFDFDELVARIEALHRRATGYTADVSDTIITNGAITFDRASLEVNVEKKPIELTKKERDLLQLLLTSNGRVLSRERILNTVWGLNADPLTNVVDVYVGRLRRKLGQEGQRIVTLRNVGYRMA
ncbi:MULTISPECIES: response regulator transcription factor [Roseobacter]|uniref:Two component signal transduction response regulator receiver protein n=1 Tax=Roseobacter litoralis (strain ATCC 49566 / DSM 6996 / JCM 21268 / NBRC 15278 / OCh 149) TaxID=391595 RepID=F7ZEM5_ROSLO|nr:MULTISPECIES: response regulator transcription factor [Roseobacter]AEI95921.1 two component signal transduction response regulator receiver protein [Roseobacter litoralis Och 149]GIT86151.1 DNA-binding response regulator [Roseobacter sp. OBYS 0001]